MDGTDKDRQWHWQEPGTAWRGVGVYHVTLTVPSREAVLGTLVIPRTDPSLATVERTPLGNAVVDELYVMCRHYPDIRLCHGVLQLLDVRLEGIKLLLIDGSQLAPRLHLATVATHGNAALGCLH